ncbi:MAG: hypothetical protein H8E18_01500, partial [FCB group bacterium]|nr:hypothetical protein [FCB group bacterium]
MTLQRTGSMSWFQTFHLLLPVDAGNVRLIQINETRGINTTMWIVTSGTTITSPIDMDIMEFEAIISGNLALVMTFKTKFLLINAGIGEV